MIYAYVGTDSYQLQQAIQKLQDDFGAQYDEIGIERLDAEEVSFGTILDAASSLSFLSAKKLLIVRNISKNKELLESLEILFEQTSEQVDLVLVESRPDKRTSWYKLLQKQAGFLAFDTLDRRATISWLLHRATQVGVSINTQSAEILVDRIGINLHQIDTELQKLRHVSGNVSRADIELHTQPTLQSSVFQLLDAAAAGNDMEALRLYDELILQKIEPQAVWAMCIWQVHIFAVVATSTTTNSAQIARDAGISPFVASKALTAITHLGRSRVKQLVALLRRYDIRLKQESLDISEVIRYFIVSVATKPS